MEHDYSWSALVKPESGEGYFSAEPRPVFDAASCAFSVPNAWWLAELSRLVYRDVAREGHLAGAGFEELAFFDRRGTQCSLVVSESRAPHAFAVLAFRGTNEPRDWLMNFRAVFGRWPGGGKVHRGFRRALEKVWGELEQVLDGISLPLFYTGHSLGGALAILAASMRAPRAVYTFGCPRVGDRGFAKTLETVPIYRVVNRRDVVPSVPPAVGERGFRHMGVPCRIEQNGRLQVGAGDDATPVQEEGEIQRELDKRRDCAGFLRPASFLADHAPVNYVASLQDLLDP